MTPFTEVTSLAVKQVCLEPIKLATRTPCFAPQNFLRKIVFNFPCNDCNTQEKLKAKVTQNFRGQTRCIMGDVPMDN